jgi:hypothetical protein
MKRRQIIALFLFIALQVATLFFFEYLFLQHGRSTFEQVERDLIDSGLTRSQAGAIALAASRLASDVYGEFIPLSMLQICINSLVMWHIARLGSAAKQAEPGKDPSQAGVHQRSALDR